MSDFRVQRAGLTSSDWKTVCTNPNEDYAREVYKKQLQVSSIGRFRLLDPNDKIIEQAQARPLFSDN